MIFLIVAILGGGSFSALQAQELPSASEFLSDLPQDSLETLFTSGQLISLGTEVPSLPYGMKTPWIGQLERSWKGKQTTLAAEVLCLINREKDKQSIDDIFLKMTNALHAVSTMEGLTYYSVTRKRREPLILSSYRVENPTQNQRLNDLVFSTVPPISQIAVFQKDNKLGEQYIEAQFSYAHSSLQITMRNMNTLYYGIFPLVKPGELQTTFYITPLKDKIAIYAALGVKTFSFFGLEKSKEESFLNRLKALSDWVKITLETALQN